MESALGSAGEGDAGPTRSIAGVQAKNAKHQPQGSKEHWD
jgi:hypothetical protein